MRDNAKGGALTEVTFFILLSLYTPKHGYAVMQFIEDNTKEMCIRDSAQAHRRHSQSDGAG